MKKVLLTSLLLAIFQIAFSQKKVFKSIHCYEGAVKGNEIVWKYENLNCSDYKITLNSKQIKIKNKLSRQKFDIISYSGRDKYNEDFRDTWLCYDRENKSKCFIYLIEDNPESEIYIEYDNVVYCFRAIK